MFDQIVVIDWSANSKPKTGVDSIWFAVHGHDGVETTNVPTRHAAEILLHNVLNDNTDGRTLIGVDFSLGYPAGTVKRLGIGGDPWRSMWSLLAEQIVDGEGNENNRFEVAAALNNRITSSAGPFWGCPTAMACETLTTTKPQVTCGIRQWRAVEATLRRAGHRPFSSWQLLGAGCVGSQSLVGIPMVHRLAQRYRERFEVWPFTTSLQAPVLIPGGIVVAEVWPSLFQLPAVSDRVRDDLQVELAAEWLWRHNDSGSISSLFRPSVDADHIDEVVNEGGWVLGVDVDEGLIASLEASGDVPCAV